MKMTNFINIFYRIYVNINKNYKVPIIITNYLVYTFKFKSTNLSVRFIIVRLYFSVFYYFFNAKTKTISHRKHLVILRVRNS